MLNKLYIVLVFVISGFLLGCGDNTDYSIRRGRMVEIGDIGGRFRIYCDKTTNMAYLFYIAGHRSAITAYLNADGNPARCNEVSRDLPHL